MNDPDDDYTERPAATGRCPQCHARLDHEDRAEPPPLAEIGRWRQHLAHLGAPRRLPVPTTPQEPAITQEAGMSDDDPIRQLYISKSRTHAAEPEAAEPVRPQVTSLRQGDRSMHLPPRIDSNEAFREAYREAKYGPRERDGGRRMYPDG